MPLPLSAATLAALQAKGIIPGPASPPPDAAYLAQFAGAAQARDQAAAATAAGVASDPVQPSNAHAPGSFSGGGLHAAALAPQSLQASPPPAPGRPTAAVINAVPQGDGAGPAGESAPAPRATSNTVPGHGVSLMSPEVADQFHGAEQDQQDAQRELGENEAGAAIQNADALDAQRQRLGEEAARSDEREAVRRKALGEYAAKAKSDALDAATGKIDYSRWQHTTGLGTKFAAGIVSALGTMGRALNHQEGVSLIDKLVARDVAEQKDNLSSKRDTANASASLLSKMQSVFGDDRAAEDAATAIRLRQAALAVQAEAQRAQSPVLMAQSKAAGAQLLEKAAEIETHLSKWVPAHTTGSDPDTEYRAYAKKMLDAGDKNVIPKDEWLRTVYQGAGAGAATPKAPPGGTKSPAAMLSEADAAIRDVRGAPNTSLWKHPGDYVTSKLGIQGTKGQDADIARSSYNTKLELALHNYGVRLGDPEKAAQFVGQWKIEPNDTPETIRRKTTAFRGFIAGTGSAAANPATDQADGLVDGGP